MSGTRKLTKFELERFGPTRLTFATPLAEITPVMLAAARPSARPPESLDVLGTEEEDAPARSERGRNREPEVERLRTRLARRFTTLADEVTGAFEEFRIGAGAWTVELTAPEGMSTKGGKQALQHLRLRPTRQGHAVLIGGVVNAVTKTAELRDYEHMVSMTFARFGTQLQITPGEWEQFLRKAEVVLHNEEIATTRVSAPADILELSRRAEAPSKQQKIAILALGVVVFLAAMVSWRVIVALTH